MGAVRHGTPAILDRPKATTNIPSYNLYRTENIDRPTVLFVPTHLGELMAFRVDRESGLLPSDYGEHLWSFIPNRLLSRLQENATQIEYLMDLPPVVKDMRMVKKGANVSAAVEVNEWRSVLTQGYREARGYFSINVTDPLTPNWMWEISPDERCFAISGGGHSYVQTEYAIQQQFLLPGEHHLQTRPRPCFPEQLRGSWGSGTSRGHFRRRPVRRWRETRKYPAGDDDEIPESKSVNPSTWSTLETGEKLAEFRPELGNVRGKNGSTAPGQVKKPSNTISLEVPPASIPVLEEPSPGVLLGMRVDNCGGSTFHRATRTTGPCRSSTTRTRINRKETSPLSSLRGTDPGFARRHGTTRCPLWNWRH